MNEGSVRVFGKESRSERGRGVIAFLRAPKTKSLVGATKN